MQTVKLDPGSISSGSPSSESRVGCSVGLAWPSGVTAIQAPPSQCLPLPEATHRHSFSSGSREMRSSSRGSHTPSFVARLRARLRFRREAPITLPPRSLHADFQFPAFLTKYNSEKVGGILALDTQAGVNLISSDMVTRLGHCRRRISPRKLVPFHSAPKQGTEIIVEYQVQVTWHIEDGEQTYTTDFFVVDMPCYDILIGSDEIRKRELLELGKGLAVRRGVRRGVRLSQGEGSEPSI